MNDALVVRRREGLGNLGGVVDGLLDREMFGVELFAQRRTFEKLGDEVGLSLVHADVVDGQHPRVIECGGRSRFLLEAAKPLADRSRISLE